MKNFKLNKNNRFLMNDILNRTTLNCKEIKNLYTSKKQTKTLKKEISKKEFDKFCNYFLKDNENIITMIAYLDDLSLNNIKKLFYIKTENENSFDSLLTRQKNISQKILKKIIHRDLFFTTDRALQRIKDKDFLMKFCTKETTPNLRNAVLENPNCKKKHFEKIVDTIENAMMIQETVLKSKFCTPETYHRIVMCSSYKIVEIASKSDILDKTVELIIKKDSNGFCNNSYAKIELIKNNSVKKKYKKLIISKLKEFNLEKKYFKLNED